ncbi:LysR family transcriptional regulator [Entomohabitans teleogrylli]|uniref:LysR family transcriptional regulator n=1 Tax=Entomohabitans teleogrylli TaxID=1384589 RepID=UPI00073D7DCA|nr:LysR family transcriptional regulator [Entomohabitans teleogrylli]
MPRDNLNDLEAFVTVAREQSFTRAAALLGVSQSALSHTMKALEARLGVRLLRRTTRSVSVTDAGEQLLNSLGPRIDEIKQELNALLDMRDKPAGTVRITATDYAITHVIWPRLAAVLPEYPDINVELIIDYGLTDIVAERYDAGVRMGEQVADGMISLRIGADIRFAVVGAPAYFATRPAPQTPQELLEHNCINLRLPTHGGIHAWEFARDGREIKVRVTGQAVFNSSNQMLAAALSGIGLAWVPEEMAAPYLREGKLIRVLEPWCPLWDGYHLYYPSRRELSRAFTLVVDALRYRR